MKTSFFTYIQNNTGGSFVSDNDLDHYVIIEAEDANKANEIAEDKGIYFNGCYIGVDCECCGDRWYSADEDDGEDEPLVYGNEPNKVRCIFGGKVILHYLNGEVVVFESK